MKKISSLLIAMTIALAPTLSFATGDAGFGGHSHYKHSFKPRFHSHKHHRFCGHKGKEVVKPTPVVPSTPPVTEVPEINASGATLAFSLLGGLLLVARERRRNQA